MQVFRSILSKVCCVNVCMYRMSLVSVIIMLPANACHLKVKRNDIWTIFLLKNTYKKVICTNIKKNQLFEISFVWTVAPNTRKSDDFRELHENEPEMAALRVETNYSYLWSQFGELIFIEFVSKLFWRLLTKQNFDSNKTDNLMALKN